MKPPYQPYPNQFRKAVQSREKLVGCWCSLGSPVTTEVMGTAGFDWLLLDSEHAPNDPLSLIPQLMALKDSPSAPVVRPASNDPVLMKRLLDNGFMNFLVPMVETKEDALLAVAATRYPPTGIRGVSVSHRGNRFGTVEDFFKIANDNICVQVQIESRSGIDNIDAICAVDGIDGIFVGPSDLSAGLGHLNNPLHPEVQSAIQHIFHRAISAGKSTGILAPVEADARRYMEMGANFVAVGSDLGLLAGGSRTLRAKFIQ